jgi:hypothetical protein
VPEAVRSRDGAEPHQGAGRPPDAEPEWPMEQAAGALLPAGFSALRWERAASGVRRLAEVRLRREPFARRAAGRRVSAGGAVRAHPRREADRDGRAGAVRGRAHRAVPGPASGAGAVEPARRPEAVSGVRPLGQAVPGGDAERLRRPVPVHRGEDHGPPAARRGLAPEPWVYRDGPGGRISRHAARRARPRPASEACRALLREEAPQVLRGQPARERRARRHPVGQRMLAA